MKTPHLLIACMLTLWALFSSISLPTQAQELNIPEPVPPPAAVRAALDLDPFYQQWIDVDGFPVLASENVSPYAVKEAAYLIHRMIGHRQDILQVFAQNKERFSIIGYDQGITQIPEYSHLQPNFYHDIRGRGLGSAEANLTTSTSEENLLHYPGDPYEGGNVLIHELAHAVHERGLNKIDPEFDNRLRVTYEAAMAKGLWKDAYAAVNHKEYWAEGVNAWLHPRDPHFVALIGGTPEALEQYDPELAALVKEVFGNVNWEYTPVTTRTHQPHLQGFDPQNSPTFQWPPDKIALHKVFTNDPVSTGDGRWVNLQPYPPSELPRLQASIGEGEPTWVAIGYLPIGNYGIDDVFIYQVPFPGTEWFHGRLHDFIITDTRVGRLFLLKDGDDNLLSVYRAEAKLGRVLILPEMEIDNSPPAKIPDTNLAAAVRQQLGLDASTPITERMMQRLTTLYASKHQITNLTGLEHATQLVSLSAWENQIQDVSPLSKLAQLQELHLQANQITDITAFAGLTELRHLHLWGNQIRDISALAELTKLESLRLAGNPIQDKTPLHSLVKQNPDMELDIEVVLPEPADINEDGVVNIQDLVLVSSNFGKTGENAADINGDGVVDIVDLVKVAAALGNTAEAPSLHPQTFAMLTAANVQNWLTQAQHLNPTDIASQSGIRFLEQLLMVLTPEETVLLPNYPNPFNPETWIPYQLANPSDVQIVLYDTRGIAIRHLTLGHQPAGYYTTRNQAAYWDGRNDLGEHVATGVYFYQLQADNMSLLHKMTILK